MAVKLSTHAVKVLGAKPPAPAEPTSPETPPDPAPETVGGNLPQVTDLDTDGITHRQMFSNVLGAVVPIAWTPDGGTVWVDGTAYTEKEINELKRRNVDAATMRAVHETKRAFDGTLN